MFLGGKLQSNLPTLEEEDSERDGSRMSLASMDSVGSLRGGSLPEGGSVEAEATYQLVTLAMDFLAFPGGKSDPLPRTQGYDVMQMRDHLGVLMGYDMKVKEFTGNPLRLR